MKRINSLYGCLLVLLGVALLLGTQACTDETLVSEPVVSDSPTDPDGVDLILAIDVSALNAALEPKYASRTNDRDPEENAAIKNMTSMALCIINEEGQMVAYRVIASCDERTSPNADGTPSAEYLASSWYYTKKPTLASTHDDYLNATFKGNAAYQKGSVDWGNWPQRFVHYYEYKTNDNDYNIDAYYRDDQHYGCWVGDTRTLHVDCVGYNGFARVEQNKLAPAADPNYPDLPDFDKDGLYDDTYHHHGEDTEGNPIESDFRDYAQGERMRKSPAMIFSFKYNNPMHGPVEQLKKGNYKLYAIANFRESISEVMQVKDDKFVHPESGKSKYVGDFIYSLMLNWSPQTGLAESFYKPFFDCAVCLSEALLEGDSEATAGLVVDEAVTGAGGIIPYVRSNKARILSTTTADITLTSGNTNIHKFQLDRTVTRATFTVTNYSDKPLKISDLKLSDNFARGATHLFYKEHAYSSHSQWNGAPDVDNEKAIKPFGTLNATTKLYDPYMTIPAGETVTIFDALMYEGGETTADNPLRYQLTVEYEGCTTQISQLVPDANFNFDPSSATSKRRQKYTADALKELLASGISEVECMIGGRYGFIRYTGSGNMVYGNSETPSYLEFENTDNAEEGELWKLEKVDGETDQVYIKNISADGYLRENAVEAAYSFVDKESATPFAIEVSIEGLNRVVFLGTNAIHQYNTNSDCAVMPVAETWTYDPGSYFDVIIAAKNEPQKVNARKELNIPIEAYRGNNATTELIRYLRRNEHLEVNIGVSYNQTSVQVDFEVDVNNWNKVQNEITFH